MSEIIKHSSNTSAPSAAGSIKKKPSLGRGLGSLLGGADLADPSAVTTGGHSSANTAPPTSAISSTMTVVTQIPEEQQIWTIAIDRLVPNTQQPRQTFQPEALRDLAASIKEKGILQPITARRLNERQFEIIAGERRWRAAQQAGLHEVPVILKKVTEQDSLELAIIENIQRENLNPIEEAEAFEHLLQDYSLTQQQVAEKLGKERSSVANTLRLLSLPPEVKVMVRKNEISTGHAKVLLSVEDTQKQISLAKQIVDEKLSVRATEKLAAKAKTDLRTAASGKAPVDVDVPQRLIDGLSAELQKLVGTKVSIDYADAKGRLQIHFYSDEQLTHLVEKIRRAWEK